MPKNYKKGITLIETIIYVAISSLVIYSFVYFYFNISGSRENVYLSQEVQSNLRIILDLIEEKIKTANSVNFSESVFDNQYGFLSLAFDEINQNPTYIFLDQLDNKIKIKEGVDATTTITTNDIFVNNFLLKNLSTQKSNSVQFFVDLKYPQYDDIYQRQATTTINTRK